MNAFTDIYSDLQRRIERACRASARDPSDITLIAVSKTQPAPLLRAALDCGHRVFGENRVQEAMAHWQDLRAAYPDLQLHLIGPLQTNKVKDAVRLFDCIQTIDREKLADALAQEMEKQGRRLSCFLQVNTGAEEQKAGVLPENLDALYGHCHQIGLEVKGLMCIPPVDEPAALHFNLLRAHARRLGLNELSMGMSGDYEKAILCGATHVRVGNALFGAREN